MKHAAGSATSRGFTLVETLLAMVILSSALLLLTSSWNGSFLRIRKTQQAFEVAALLERKMTELEIEYRNKNIDEIPEEANDDFGAEAPGYSWKMSSKKLEIPDVSSTMTAKDGGADEFTMSIVKQLTEAMSKSIKEVTVTIVYAPPKAKKPLEYSATTYFIDYDKDINLGMPGGQ